MPSNKRNNHEENDENKLKCLQSFEKPLELTDLPEDVLVEIFSKLNVLELIDVVNVSGTFLLSCGRAFQKLYRSKYVELPLQTMNGNINFKRHVDFFRCFEGYISKVNINIDRETAVKANLCEHIADSVLEICHENLTEIKICGISTKLKINKQFPNLKTLGICCGFADNSMFQFAKWFPKLENLFLHNVSNTSTRFNTRREIPSLTQLSVVENVFGEDHFGIRKLNNFIKKNPQIKVLSLLYGGVKCLNDVNICGSVPAPDELMTLKLNQIELEDPQSLPEKLIISHDRIGHLEIDIYFLDRLWCDFIGKCSSLNVLNLTMILDLDNGEFFKGSTYKQTANHVPLTHLEICFEMYNYDLFFDKLHVGLDAISPYLEQCQTLSTVHVSYRFFGHKNLIPFVDKVKGRFDRINAKIDSRRWSFSHKISTEFRSSFTLNKISN